MNTKRNLYKLPKLGKSHNCNTRQVKGLTCNYHTLTFYNKNPSYAGIKLYNTLAEEKYVENIQNRKLEIILLRKPLYSEDE